MAETKADILLVSTADWDNPYWTNKQHVAVELARRGHRVFYVESQGLRAPTATTKDIRRIFNRLKRVFKSPRAVAPGLWVWSPFSIPLQGNRFLRQLNRALLRFGSGFWLRKLGLNPSILWTYSPLTTEFYDIDRYKITIYHAVDDIKEQPGMPKQAIETAEHSLSSKADLIFTTAENLQRHHSALNKNTHYFPNVADFDHFARARLHDTTVPNDLEAIAGPRIGFVGAISSYKLDFKLISLLASLKPNWSFVFIGEVGEGDPGTRADDLLKHQNVHFLGGRSYSLLPNYLRGIDVAIIPSLINNYTISMFPMKFFEYLAAGKPIVSSPLPALAAYSHVAAFADDAESFSLKIDDALNGKCAAEADRLAEAREHTYRNRTDRMMQIVDSLNEA